MSGDLTCDSCIMSVYFNFNLWTFQKLELANNKIRSMDGLQGHKYLEIIDLEENDVRFILFVHIIIGRDVTAVKTSIHLCR